MEELHNLGICPTGEHVKHPQCGCPDLRPWAKANRYRYRFEESYNAEDDAHVRVSSFFSMRQNRFNK
jgi:hypothetical protein